MSDLAGQLEVRVDACSGAVAIGSSRPLTAARVFVGKSPAEVVRQLPTLFSLCGTAQAAACVGACEQALGWQPSAEVLARRWALVQAETVKEHLWRLLLDWPPLLAPRPELMTNANATAPAQGSAFAGPPATSAMPRVMRSFMALRQTQQSAGNPFTLDTREAERGAAAAIDPEALLELVIEQAFGTAPADWLAAVDSRAALQRWAEQTETPAAGLVRAISSQGLAGYGANSVARLPEAPWRVLAGALASADAEAFIAAPQWQQHCAETGPLARVAAQPLITALLAAQGNGLLTRLAALLVDLAQSAEQLRAASSAPFDVGQMAPISRATATACAESGQATVHGGTGADEVVVDQGLDSDANVGIGAAEAARGLLLHRVRIKDDCLDHYQILAPTEWNFHPQGVVAQGLAAIARGGTKGEELERLARLYITAVDPCVDYQLSVS